MDRSSGILLSISSLPSPYGIGTMGREARAFADFLSAAGQKIWQVLPLGPTSFGDSPYQSCSAFAGNPYLIDLDALIDEGLLSRDEVASLDWGNDPARVDYKKLYDHRFSVLEKACGAFMADPNRARELAGYEQANAAWLNDYALFMALKDRFGGRPFTEWPRELRLREPGALMAARSEQAERMHFYAFIQLLFDRQWTALKRYCNEKHIRIVGDIPIYVPLDSADVWAAPEGFQLDSDRRPRFVAGVPPDYFSADGQLWGNPLYDWEAMRRDGYAWWIRRMGSAVQRYDIVRFDHFRGLSSYWRVPYGETTARNGEWIPGPGMDFINAIKAAFPRLAMIAEDLGFLTPDVQKLLADSGFPGMKVLEFAFDAREPSNYLPHTYIRNCVCYTGTHDNTTALGWFSDAAPEDVAFAKRYLGLSEAEGLAYGMIRGGMGSVSDLFIAQMQDYLNLDGSARMNIPGTLGGGNWQWRMESDALTEALASHIREMARMYAR